MTPDEENRQPNSVRCSDDCVAQWGTAHDGTQDVARRGGDFEAGWAPELLAAQAAFGS
jgi:hypothetical protein